MPEQNVWRYTHRAETLVTKLTNMMLSYRLLLQHTAPELCAQLDAEASKDPQLAAKLMDQAPLHMDDLMSDKDIACLVGVADSTVRKWASDGLINRHIAQDGSTAFLVQEVWDMLRNRRLRAG